MDGLWKIKVRNNASSCCLVECVMPNAYIYIYITKVVVVKGISIAAGDQLFVDYGEAYFEDEVYANTSFYVRMCVCLYVCALVYASILPLCFIVGTAAGRRLCVTHRLRLRH